MEPVFLHITLPEEPELHWKPSHSSVSSGDLQKETLAWTEWQAASQFPGFLSTYSSALLS